MVSDFHTHTFWSDGELSPIELARRAHVNGYAALAITDHAGMGGLDRLLAALAEDCRLAQGAWGFPIFPGVELTHLPPARIAEAAALARRCGAVVVVIHGETPVEPVEPGTNLAAVQCPDVDILAHPGFITPEEAALAARHGVFLELSARRGHSLTNGYVAGAALQADALLLVDSDAHAPQDLLTARAAWVTARGAGLDEETAKAALEENPRHLVKRLLQRWPAPVR
ncbi:MAG: histidinol phosphate phosphatase domain-containing protein [Chloroflexi bacterium]|nr:histidinol phosphate phosphatase domain-containing protein [Chloroflexota bacterium]